MIFLFPSLYSVRYLSHPSVWSLFLLGQLIDLSPYLVSWLISLPPWPADWSLFLLGQLTDLLPSSADWSLFLLGQLTDLSPYLVSWLISHPTWSADWSLYLLGQLTDFSSFFLVSWLITLPPWSADWSLYLLLLPAIYLSPLSHSVWCSFSSIEGPAVQHRRCIVSPLVNCVAYFSTVVSTGCRGRSFSSDRGFVELDLARTLALASSSPLCRGGSNYQERV